MKKLILLLLLFIQGHTFIAGSLYASEPTKILFIGSSYFNFNNLPALLKNLVAQSPFEVEIDSYMQNGLFLADHANSPITEGKIRSTSWDYIIFQGAGSLMAYPDSITHHPVRPAISTLRELILQNSPNTRIVFCMPWAFEDGMTWKEGWSDSYDDMQEKIDSVTLIYEDEFNLLIAPVGRAWAQVLKEKEYPLHYLHQSDWNHPTVKGSYLTACVLFSTLFHRSSQGNSFRTGLSKEEARYFQHLASEIVKSYP